MKQIEFTSKDRLPITADYYEVKNPKGMLLCCHRSHCNRAEYRETAPKFNQLGYSCLAIDQRSGMKIFGTVNETKNRAKEKGLPTGYLDAQIDVEAAVDFAYTRNKKKAIIILGSSYSAALALRISTQTDKIKTIIVFSPGEYLKGVQLAQEIRDLSIPIFATSPKAEIDQVSEVLQFIPKKYVTQFKPDVNGFHGSKTLWESVDGHKMYWRSLKTFLHKLTGA